MQYSQVCIVCHSCWHCSCSSISRACCRYSHVLMTAFIYLHTHQQHLSYVMTSNVYTMHATFCETGICAPERPSAGYWHEVWCVWQAGLVPALAKLLKQGDMPGQVREAVSEALKHLTASSQKNRNSLVSLQVLPLLIAQLQTGQLPHSLLFILPLSRVPHLCSFCPVLPACKLTCSCICYLSIAYAVRQVTALQLAPLGLNTKHIWQRTCAAHNAV